MANPSTVSHPSASIGSLGFNPANNSAALLKCPRTPLTNHIIDYQTADSEHVLKRMRTFGISDEVRPGIQSYTTQLQVGLDIWWANAFGATEQLSLVLSNQKPQLRCFDSNLIDIPVEVETPDHKYYHIVFSTKRNVEAHEELTWDNEIDFEDKEHPIKVRTTSQVW
ncbi:histone-lysine N-methyltransferase SUVR4 isoform X2 [Tanacetum coccineum]